MNTKLFALAFAVAVAALTGCATTTTARPAVSDPLPPPIAAVPPGYMAAPVVPGMVPPPRPEPLQGPPQSWAWLHTPPMGCDQGPNSLAIANDTDYFARIVLDGEDLQVRGAYGTLPMVPPNSVVFVCLAHTGEHTLGGVMYVTRYGVPQELLGDRNRFEYRGPFGNASHPSGRNEFHINVATLVLM